MITLELPAETGALRLVGPWLRALLTYSGEEQTDAIAERLDLALQEVCVNIVEHAYEGQHGGRIRLDYEHCEGHRFTVSDSGRPFDPTKRPLVDLDTPTEGGYGLHLIEELCDSFGYERRNGRNRWTLHVS
ncbi:MAG: ATP-binding protein [Acidimicrobiales bacterium]